VKSRRCSSGSQLVAEPRRRNGEAFSIGASGHTPGMKTAVSIPNECSRRSKDWPVARGSLGVRCSAPLWGSMSPGMLRTRLLIRSTKSAIASASRMTDSSRPRLGTFWRRRSGDFAGEVWWADLGLPRGSEPSFRKLVVVVQGDALNRSRIATVVCVPLTSNLTWADAAGNVLPPLERPDSRRTCSERVASRQARQSVLAYRVGSRRPWARITPTPDAPWTG
jgi:PemK-like, MazF-like toxin of type II toxin-antitoxin system